MACRIDTLGKRQGAGFQKVSDQDDSSSNGIAAAWHRQQRRHPSDCLKILGPQRQHSGRMHSVRNDAVSESSE